MPNHVKSGLCIVRVQCPFCGNWREHTTRVRSEPCHSCGRKLGNIPVPYKVTIVNLWHES
ncbi:hypothetical protein LCGC14_1154430 [marine sediment metagenome]|uniref:Uncharacterized protein n=1 Tax=marine sediment metagenome TaxID=412755 RepID=A0A0F9MHQ9_9ZZZZ